MMQLLMDSVAAKTDTEFLNLSKFWNPKSYSSVKSKELIVPNNHYKYSIKQAFSLLPH